MDHFLKRNVFFLAKGGSKKVLEAAATVSIQHKY